MVIHLHSVLVIIIQIVEIVVGFKKTATSHSAPGNNYSGWTDVFISIPAYHYFDIRIDTLHRWHHTLMTLIILVMMDMPYTHSHKE